MSFRAVTAAGALLLLAAQNTPDPRFPKGLAWMDPGPLPHGLRSWTTESCIECHASTGAAWESSGHASARTGFVFAASVTEEDPAWCVRCHAPLAGSGSDPREAPLASSPADQRGVGCAACHAGSTHGGRAFAVDDPELCGGCHQFGFAVRDARGSLARLAGDPQQDTLEEWRRWSARTGDTRTCVDCHMKGGDHSFGGTHRAEALRDALRVEAAGPTTLRLVPADVGHRFPTGDVLRWISVEAAADPLFEAPLVVARFGRTLAYGAHGGEPRPFLGSETDNRLDGPATVSLPARDAAGRTLVAWRVVYHLVSEEQETDGTFPAAVSRLVLRTGLITKEGKP